MIPRYIIDEIFQTAQIEEVIGDFVNLKKAGSNFKGLSPWSNEKSPSFMVSPAKRIFKDFSSGKGGTVVTFLMEHEQMSYPEALRYLAKRYNIEIPEEAPDPEQEESQKKRESLFKVTEFASSFFEEELWNSDRGKAIGLSYFRERGFSDDIIKKFQLGYADPSFDSLIKKAESDGYKLELLLEGGLAKKKSEEANPYDNFRDRVVFPIHNVAGRCVGFGARILSSNTKAPKYLNSPESLIYNKSKLLYGMYQARAEVVKQDRCLLVEGYTDVISLYQSGVKNAVASSGTSLTEDQIRLIRRYTKNITILYDGDEAGIKASFRGIDLILKEGLNVNVLLFPEGEDPDSFAKSHSAEELEEFISKRSEDFVFFKARVLGKENQKNPQQRAESIRDIVSSIALIPDHITRNVYVAECSRLLDIAESALITEINKIRRKELGRQMKRRSDDGSKETLESLPEEYAQQTQEELQKFDAYHQELDILRLIFCYHEEEIEHQEKTINAAQMIVSDIQKDELGFDDETSAQIYAEILHQLSEYDAIRVDDFLNHEDDNIRSLVVNFLSEPYELHKWAEKEIFVHDEKKKLKKAILSALYAFKARKVELMILDIQNKLSSSDLGDDEMIILMKKKSKLDKVRMLIGDKLGRVIMHY